jgi:hypothetical protein
MTKPGESVLQTIVAQDPRRQWFWDEDNMKFTIMNDDGSQETVSLDVNDEMRPKVSLYIARALGQLQQ